MTAPFSLPPPGLVLIHGNRAESLRGVLVTWMREHPLAPLEREVVLVQSNGIAQWLKLALAQEPQAGGCGIAAGLDFVLPSRFLWTAYRAVLGEAVVPADSPFDKAWLVWRVLRLLPELLDEPVYAPLEHFLHGDTDQRKRYQLAERLADLFDQYQVYRADWLMAWAAGEDVLIEARGGRRALAEEQCWQPAMWRRIVADVASSGTAGRVDAGGRVAVHAAFIERARVAKSDERPAGLPRRVLVFGVSTLPRQALEVLQALSRWVQVFVCVPNPCQHYWADIVTGQELLRAERARQARKPGAPVWLDDSQLRQHAHPLLAAWGKQGRDFIALLDEMDDPQARAVHETWLKSLGQRIDLFERPEGATLLAQIQADILDLTAEAEIAQRATVVNPATDRSLRFHIAHSPQREVEILHDQLLDAFACDPELRPRDVVVMVPDIAAYAPHIEAVFGLVAREDPRFIPYSIADQNARGVDPLLNALERLLNLAQSRLGLSEVLEWLDVAAIRARFGFAEADLATLRTWLHGANVRWGLNDAHRQKFDLPPVDGVAQHTWQFGLRRLLLGYAVGETGGAWGDIEPYGAIGGKEAALLGPLIEFLAQLEATWQQVHTPVTPAEWVKRLRGLLKTFFKAESAADRFTLLRLGEALQDWLTRCDEAGLREPLPLAIVAEPWLAALEAGGLSQRFLAGSVTFATLMPMRAIPFKQVCLLGMHDGAYPRSRPPVDFDLMGQDYRPGDRSRREDDRYLFLEALLAVRQALYVSWVGRSVTDNSERPASVLVAQLRDHLRAGWRLHAGDTDGQALLDGLTVEHRLQPFSPEYLYAMGPYFTYAREWGRAGEGGRAEDEARGAGEGGALSPSPAPGGGGECPGQAVLACSLDELVGFCKAPVKAFMQKRLEVYFDEVEQKEDVEPFTLDGLEQWQFKDELIRAALADVERADDLTPTRDETVARWQRSGDLPPGGFAVPLVQGWQAGQEVVLQDYREALALWPEALDKQAFAYRLDNEAVSIEVEGWLPELRQGRVEGELQRACLTWSASNLVDGKQYRLDKALPYWIRHLAGHLALGPIHTRVISPVGTLNLSPLTVDEARGHFETLLRLWQAGMRRPLPLALKTANAWLHARGPAESDVLDKARGAARAAYEGGFNNEGEVGHCPYLERAYPDFAALTASGEFETLAEQLLRPLWGALPSTTAKQPTKKGEA